MKIDQIKEYINTNEVRELLNIQSNKEIEVSLLGQGEYNVNFLFINPDNNKKLVLRLNTASQMNLDDQISYEFNVLKMLELSGRTPKPIFVDSSMDKLPYGLLVMEFLPGFPLDYKTDLEIAASCLADIHCVDFNVNNQLITPKNPLKAVLEECVEMSSKYLNSDIGDENIKIIIKRLIEKSERSVLNIDENLNKYHIINTELNSGNFLINGKGKNNYIIDWEKPILGEVEQDLGHFLAPTTTFWKTDVILTRADMEEFVRMYIEKVNGRFETKNLWDKLEKYIIITCLRGITWCSMAWVEYQAPDKLIRNEFTYNKIENYLKESFLLNIEDEYFNKL
jgi:aminoglycoside phosphotransferase (APT) family kinase protein